MVDSWYCLDRVVPKGMSQVSRWSEVGNHKRRTPNTQLSSGTSAGTFAVSAGLYINYRAEAGTKNESDTFLYHFKKGVRKLVITFRTGDFVDFCFKGFRSTLHDHSKSVSRSIILGQFSELSVNVIHGNSKVPIDIHERCLQLILKFAKCSMRGKRKMNYGLWNNPARTDF